jgi:O-antigen/teichoic acid export membrane protein
MGMDTSYQIFKAQDVEGNQRRKLLTTATIIATMSAFIIWGPFSVVAFSGSWLKNYAKVSTTELTWYLFGLVPVILISWYLYIFRFTHNALPFARTNILSKTVSSVVILLSLFFTPPQDRLNIFFLGTFFSQALIWGWALWELKRSELWPYHPTYFSSSLARNMFKFGVVFIPGAVTYAAVLSADRLIVGWLAGPAETSLVQLANSVGSVILILKAWFMLIWVPSLVEWLSSKKLEVYLPKMQVALTGLSFIFFPLACLSAIWVDLPIAILYPPEYASVAHLLPVVVLTGACSTFSLIAIGTIILHPSPKYYFSVYICALAITVLLGLRLVPHLGALGAVLGTLGAELFILGSWILRGKYLIKNINLNWRPVLIMGIISGIFSLLYQPGIIMRQQVFLERIVMTLIISTPAALMGRKVAHQILSGDGLHIR